MPIKMKVEREGFNKFKLEELGLNITENPGNYKDDYVRKTRTYSDKSSSSHSYDREQRVNVKLVTIQKDHQPFLGLIYGTKVAILPMVMNYVKDMACALNNSGRSEKDTFSDLVKKVSINKQTLTPYLHLVESWFRNAGDPRIPGARIIDLSEISSDTRRAEEIYIKTNTSLPFFNYLSECLNMAIEVYY